MIRNTFFFAGYLVLLLQVHALVQDHKELHENSNGEWVKKLPSEANQILRQNGGQDRWDALGFGVLPYDALFEHSNLRARVLDLGLFKNSEHVRSGVTVQFFDKVRTESRIDEGFDEFTRKLQIDVNAGISVSSFKSSVSSHFEFETTQRTDYFFSRTASIVERAHIRVTEPTISNLRSLVMPSVAAYLATSSPQKIFSVYGTHVTTGLIVGGQLELWSSSSKTSFSSKEEFSLGVKASFKKFVAGSSSLTTEETRLSSLTETEGLFIKGGVLNVGREGERHWVASTANNAQEISYLPNGVVPIWDLIPNQAQANRVRDWYRRVFGSKAVILKRFSSAPLETLGRTAHPEAQIYVPSGWKVVSGGANVEFFGAGQLLTKSFPIVEGGKAVGWKVQSKDHLESDPGRIQAHAIAIWDPFDACDVSVRKSTSTRAAHPSTSVTLPGGYTQVGGGASTLFVHPGSMLVSNYPTSSRTWFASSKDHLRSAPSIVEAYVIGVKFRDGGAPTTRVKNLTFGPAQHPFGTVQATEGFRIIGGGAVVSRGGPGNMLVSVIPSEDGTQFYAKAKDHLVADQQRITVYAIEIEGAVFVSSVDEVLLFDPTRL